MEGRDLASVGSGGDEHGASASDRGAAAVSVAPHNVWVGARYTTLRLEPIFWEGLADIAASRRTTVHEIVTEVALLAKLIQKRRIPLPPLHVNDVLDHDPSGSQFSFPRRDRS